MLKRGHFVPIVSPGSYGKPRPALIIQSDLFNELPSITVLPLTSTLRNVSLFRIRVEPSRENGLTVVSEIMVDKILTLPNDKIGQPFGKIDPILMEEVSKSLIVFLGIV